VPPTNDRKGTQGNAMGMNKGIEVSAPVVNERTYQVQGAFFLDSTTG
jgi:hypothetical protein